MSKIRILVLTSSTGGGHDARARAFAEWCFELYRHEIEVRIEQMLEKSSVVNRLGVDFYNRIQTGAPWIHQGFYAVVEVLSLLNSRSVTFGGRYYARVLREYRPHLILSVHDCLNRGYFPVARKLLGAEAVRCATYCGEFSGGWGYSRNWVEPTVDLYFSRTAAAQAYAIRLGVPADRARGCGNLMAPRAHREAIAPGGRGAFRVERLGLEPDLFTVFLATGGNGANNHRILLDAMLRHAGRCQAVVICGRNRDAYNEVIRWRANHPELGCYVEGYSEIDHLLMQACDAVVTRGGTTTCAKALHFGCPIIFNAFGGIMPQEELTWRFFRDEAGSEKIANAGDFERLLGAWLEQPEAWRRARERFMRLGVDEDPTRLIADLVGLAGSAAGVAVSELGTGVGAEGAGPEPGVRDQRRGAP